MSALCSGRWELFDSTNLADHRRAAAFCRVCPMRAQCKGLLREAQQTQIIAGAGNGPQGTWAGRLINPRQGHL